MTRPLQETPVRSPRLGGGSLDHLAVSYGERQLIKTGRYSELLRLLERRQQRLGVLWFIVVVILGASATISLVEFGRESTPMDLVVGLAHLAIAIVLAVSATNQWARLREGIQDLRGRLEGDGPEVDPNTEAPPNP